MVYILVDDLDSFYSAKKYYQVDGKGQFLHEYLLLSTLIVVAMVIVVLVVMFHLQINPYKWKHTTNHWKNWTDSEKHSVADRYITPDEDEPDKRKPPPRCSAPHSGSTLLFKFVSYKTRISFKPVVTEDMQAIQAENTCYANNTHKGARHWAGCFN